ncbi:MAG: protein kinase [Acidobacteria bacterium]|nr:protein kinase [Acidobacteriota bacterium]
MNCPKCNHPNSRDTKFCGNCGHSLSADTPGAFDGGETLMAPLSELTRGMTLTERYEVIEQLGKGGMGKVYRVLDKKIHEEIALKLLNPQVAMDEKAIERFRNELKFARKVSHRYVCRVYDIYEEEGTHYITMESFTGTSSRRIS